jgi:hypothetical protein
MGRLEALPDIGGWCFQAGSLGNRERRAARASIEAQSATPPFVVAPCRLRFTDRLANTCRA